jgi:RimJ/RimL family protein N-acetyltransferase
LKLQLRSREELLAMFEGMPEVSPEWLDRVRAAGEPDAFLFGYAVVLREGGDDLGSAGFKGPPDDDGMVEIAYGIEPAHQSDADRN